MKCDHCGAAVRRGDGRFCSHCGTKLPDVPRITPEDWITHPERFAEARADPRFAKAMQAAAPPPATGQIIFPLVFLVFWIAIGSTVAFGFAKAGGAIVLFPIALVGAGVVMVAGQIKKALKVARAPVARQLAVVLDERTHVSGGGKNSSARTSYFATLVYENGQRAEVSTTGNIAGMIARGDIGVAVQRLDNLVDFHRIDD